MDFTITHERGPMTRQVRQAALAWGGEAAWEQLLHSVSESCRARFQHPVGFFEWVPSPLAVELHDAWAKLRGLETMRERGEGAAHEMLALGGVQAWILKAASIHFLLVNVPRIFAFYYRGGRLDLVNLDGNTCVYALQANGYPEAWFTEGLPGWIRVALERSGAKDINVHCAKEGTERHRYQVTWRD